MEMVPKRSPSSWLGCIIEKPRARSVEIARNKLYVLIPPRPLGYERSREVPNIRTELTFDALGLAETAADMVFETILHPARAGRLKEYSARDAQQLSLNEVLNTLIDKTWKSPRQTGYASEIQKTTENVLLHHLFQLASDKSASQVVKAEVYFSLEMLKNWLAKQNNTELQAHYFYAKSQIEWFQSAPSEYTPPKILSPPAGSPIGCGETHN